MDTLSVMLQAQSAAGGSGWTFWIMMLVIIAIMYFFMIRPQNKRQKELNNFRNNLTRGQQVVTTGGIYGKIKSAENGNPQVVLEIADDVCVKVDRSCILADPTLQPAK